MGNTFKVIAILSPFVAAILTYFLSVQKKRKDVSIEKERVLNKVLSDLLSARNIVARVNQIRGLSNVTRKTVFPVEQLPQLLISSGIVDLHHFDDLEKSIAELKEYDAISFFYLEGIGNDLRRIHDDYLRPTLNADIGSSGGQEDNNPMIKLINETVETLDDNISDISGMLGKRVKRNSKKIIQDLEAKNDVNDLIDEVEQYYFEWMSPHLSPNKPLTFEEFENFSRTEEFQQILQLQLLVAKTGDLEKVLDLVKKNPNMSIEELSRMLTEQVEI
ncbi:MAG: hypothetical protein ACFHU9_05465 [Fluviicola sp.]